MTAAMTRRAGCSRPLLSTHFLRKAGERIILAENPNHRFPLTIAGDEGGRYPGNILLYLEARGFKLGFQQSRTLSLLVTDFSKLPDATR